MSTGGKYILVNNSILNNFFQRNIVEYCVLVFKFFPLACDSETRLNLTREILLPKKSNKTAAKSQSGDLYALIKPNQNISPDRPREPLIYPAGKLFGSVSKVL
jgi:hypothetical protein